MDGFAKKHRLKITRPAKKTRTKDNCKQILALKKNTKEKSTASASDDRKKDIPFSPSSNLFAQNGEEQECITIPELVKKLVVPPEKRTEDDCELMADALYIFITSVAAFKEGFLKTAALAVARYAELRTVGARETVFLQGEVGGDFYFVLQGSVAIKINNKVIKILGDKTAFGELAMQCKCKRSASVVGAENGTQLLVIRKKLYHRHMAKTHRREMGSKLKFIKMLHASTLSPHQIAILCTCIKLQKVKRNQTICSAEGPPKFLYYLIEGSAEQHIVDNSTFLRKIIRARSRCSVKMFKEIMDKNRRKKNKPEMHRLAVLLAGQMFGEASWVYGQQAMSTVIARSECKLWVISHAHVRQLVRSRMQVQDYLEKMTRMKLQFRLARLDTLTRARKSLQPARSTRTSKAWARKLENKKSPSPSSSSPSSSSSSFVSIFVNDRSVKKDLKRPKTRKRSESCCMPRVQSVMSPHVKRAPASQTKWVQASSVGNFFTYPKPLPRVFGSGVMGAKSARKPQPHRNCDKIKSQFSDKYDRTNNNTPRELLASVVDDFNSGDPELVFPQHRQSVMTIDKNLRRKSKRRNCMPECNSGEYN